MAICFCVLCWMRVERRQTVLSHPQVFGKNLTVIHHKCQSFGIVLCIVFPTFQVKTSDMNFNETMALFHAQFLEKESVKIALN